MKVVNMKDYNKHGFGLMDVKTKKLISLDGKKPLILTKKKALSCIGAGWLNRVYLIEMEG